MTTTEARAGYEALASITGPVEFPCHVALCPAKTRLIRYSMDSFVIRCPGNKAHGWEEGVTPYVALCLHREHVRQWLAERGWYVRQSDRGYWWPRMLCPLFADYDAFLQAAVDAVGKEGVTK